jgi:anaerobic magnesium-protoporphyrin IX monomethyl ester cyclase
MDVLVINPSSSMTKNVIRDVMYGCWCKGKRIGGATVPPFALLNLATIAQSDGQNVTFLDAQAEQIPMENIINRSDEWDIVICSTSTMSFREDADHLLAMKKVNPRLKSIIYGSHPTFMPEYSLAHDGIDICVRREPEFIVRDLLKTMENRDDSWKSVPGIAYHDENQEVITNPEYPFLNMDDLPLPNTDFLPKGVDYYNPLVRRMPYITVTTSKGCPALCTFCTAPYFDGMKVRFMSTERVKRLVDYLVLEKGFREIYFRDDTFFVKKDRDKEMCRHIIDNNIDVSWIANARVAMMDKDMMRIAKDAGCHTMKFGIESGNQAILDRMRKGYTIDQAFRVFEWVHEIGINAHAHVMLGNPGETAETMQQTIDFVKQLDPATATFGICTPYPGTPLFAEVAAIHPEIKDGTASDLSKLHVQGLFNEHYTSLTRDELQNAVQQAYREFYLRPKYFANVIKNQFRSTDDFKRVAIAASNVVDFAIRGE